MPSARVKAACRLPVVPSVQALTSTAYGLPWSPPVTCGTSDSLPRAEVVEQHLGAGRQQGRRLRVEVPEPAVGDVAALVGLAFGDLTGRRHGVGVRGEPDGGDGGEPADGPGVVVLVQGRYAAVPFQLDGEIGGRRLYVGQRGPQRAAQQLGQSYAE